MHVNDTINKLTMISEPFLKQYGKTKKSFIKCKCICGNEKEILLYNVRNGHAKSCGCLLKKQNKEYKKNFKHSLTKHPLYKLWRVIKNRCYNKNSKDYKDYGGRGITFADYWKNNAKQFYNDNIMEWKPGLQIDRINNNGNYELGNVRFVTSLKQANNKRSNHYITIFEETKTRSEWSRDIRCLVKSDTFVARIKSGWDPKEALTTPRFKRRTER